MYSEQLEALIQGIIADGIITDKERGVLHKKAEAEGIDIDEIDIYVEGLIAQSGKAIKKKAARQYNFDALIQDIGEDTKYYKLKESYISKDHRKGSSGIILSFKFADITECSTYKDKKIAYNELYNGLCLLFSFSEQNENDFSPRAQYRLLFTSGQKELLSLRYDRHLHTYYNTRLGHGNTILLKQNIDNVKHSDTIGYIITKEQLESLCHASNIQIEAYDEHSFDGNKIQARDLPGFQYYAQYCYRVMFDPEAYPDSEEKLANAIEGADERKSPKNGLSEQQTAGLLSRKIKGKRIKPTPYYLSQYQILNATITDAGGRVIFDKNRYYKKCLYLHAISTKENEQAFYLCLTSQDKENEFILCINLQDHTLYPVTNKRSDLADKNIHDGNNHFNFYYIDSETLRTFLTAKGSTIKLTDYGREKEYKLSSIPKKWKKTFEILNQKNGISKWAEEKGGFTKFLETYLHLSLAKFIGYSFLIFIGLLLLLFLLILAMES